MENFGKFMTILLSIIVLPLVKGFVFMKLFNWFAVPILKIEEISILLAIGLVYLISLVTVRYEKTKSDDFDWTDFFKRMLFGILYPAFILFIGWIVSLLI